VNTCDYLVLVGVLLAIAAYGTWRTRRRSLETYLKGDGRTRWLGIGLSVMATQASAITFMSTPGQGYADGLGFVQNYFGLPLALIVVAAVFLPLFSRSRVYTAYEFLGRRFDEKTRRLGAGIFLLQRGLAAGITIYAPAIVLSAVFGWRLEPTILLSGAVAIAYTAVGGSDAVTLTQRYQMAVIFSGMAAAFVLVLIRLGRHASLADTLTVAGAFHKLQAVDFSVDYRRRYTLWSGLLGGFFLSLSYFGTDQSQVQRYLTGSPLRESRLGLMFNAVLKIPMQFLILLLGVLVFVFYQFEPAPLVYNQAEWRAAAAAPHSPLQAAAAGFAAAQARERAELADWTARHDPATLAAALAAGREAEAARARAVALIRRSDPHAASDNDYVFIRFVVDQLPHGLIGLLVAVFFAAALSSKSAELNALASTTIVDFYRPLLRPHASDRHYVSAGRWLTVLWGLAALGFALLARLAENLIQAINILGSLFYGVPLALFLAAFFLRRVGGTAIFWAGVIGQALVLALYATTSIGYLWYNLIGCAACLGLALGLRRLFAPAAEPASLP
jgi:SSS family solute:Na+ symporter